MRFLQHAICALFPGLLTVSGCNLPGYTDLGSEFDVVESIGTEDAESWIRISEAGINELITFGGIPEGEERGGFAFFQVAEDASSNTFTGDYSVEDNTISLVIRFQFYKPNEFDVPPVGRVGSQRFTLDPPEEEEMEAVEDGDTLTLTIGGTPSTFYRLDDRVAALDPAEEADALLLLRLYNITNISLQTRIPGFGGNGMMQYMGKTTTFTAILNGSAALTLESPFSPTTTTAFDDYADLSGITLTRGDQVTATDTGGNGTLSGTVQFLFEAEDSHRITGDVTYAIDLARGASAAGEYIIVADGNTWAFPYDVVETLDLTALF